MCIVMCVGGIAVGGYSGIERCRNLGADKNGMERYGAVGNGIGGWAGTVWNGIGKIASPERYRRYRNSGDAGTARNGM